MNLIVKCLIDSVKSGITCLLHNKKITIGVNHILLKNFIVMGSNGRDTLIIEIESVMLNDVSIKMKTDEILQKIRIAEPSNR